MTGQVEESDKPEVEVPVETTKDLVLKARGHSIPVDYFLYSCLEDERLARAKAGTGAPVLHWPPLEPTADGSPAGLGSSLERGDFLRLAAELIAWYREHVPTLANQQTLDHEQIHLVVPGVVALAADLATLHQVKLGTALPEIPRGKPGEGVWNDLATLLAEQFPTYGRAYILPYAQWAHTAEFREDFEPGSRPPVGRFAPPMPRFDRGDRGGDRGGGRGGDRKGGRPGGPGGRGPDGPGASRPRPPRQDASSEDRGGEPRRPPRPQHGEGERPARSHRGGPDGGDRSHSGPRRDRGDGRRPPRRSDDETATLKAHAMSEVDAAIAKLKSEPGVAEVVLKPTNSFYRRIQHQKAIDEGFHSSSVGEGPDRAVMVTRE